MTPSAKFKYREPKPAIPHCPSNCQAWHTMNHVAALLSASRRTVYDLMSAGKLAYSETDFGRRIHHAEIDNYLKSNKVK